MDFIDHVADAYREHMASNDDDPPMRFQVTMEADLASEVCRFAERADISRSGAICYLVDYAFQSFRQTYSAQKMLDAARDPNDQRVRITDENGNPLTGPKLEKALDELLNGAH